MDGGEGEGGLGRAWSAAERGSDPGLELGAPWKAAVTRVRAWDACRSGGDLSPRAGDVCLHGVAHSVAGPLEGTKGRAHGPGCPQHCSRLCSQPPGAAWLQAEGRPGSQEQLSSSASHPVADQLCACGNHGAPWAAVKWGDASTRNHTA